MPLSSVRFEDVSYPHLTRLIEHGVREGLRLDVKRSLPGDSADDKREFLRDLTAFANAEGGDILYGVDEKDGILAHLPGIAPGSVDATILRLTSLASDCVDPRIPNLRIRGVDLEDGKVVVLVRVPRSIIAPHMVTFNGLYQYWTRQSGGKARMSSSDVRNSVLRNHDWQDRVLTQHRERVVALRSNDGPISVHEGLMILTHVTPLSDQPQLDITRSAVRERLDSVGSPLRGRHGRWYTFDGYLMADPAPGALACSYRLCYYDGRVEACYVSSRVGDSDSNPPRISIHDLEDEIIGMFMDDVEVMKILNVAPPLGLLLAVSGVHGHIYTAPHDDHYDLRDRLPFRTDPLIFPPLLIEEYPNEIRPILKPLLDRLWQAGGFTGTPARR